MISLTTMAQVVILDKQMHTIVTIFLFVVLFMQAQSLGLKKEKQAHLRFYAHPIMSSNPTVYLVAQAAITNTSKTGFGGTFIIDEPLTVAPELTSKQVGRLQGIAASADLNVAGALFVANFVFTDGKYNGSSLSMLGRMEVDLPVREMPIVGGSGVFRFSRGYTLTKSLYYNATSGDAIFEYNVYVLHY